MYGVPTKALNQAARRNSARFPPDFLFRLTVAELGAMSVFIVRALAHLRGCLESNPALAWQLDELASKDRDHDDAIAAVLSAIRNLMSEPPGKRRGIGFTAALEP
jgi:hypothetical protein